ncbi:peptidase T [Ligilactobacillus apodemi]|uniref:peptidase T n=1 Tax=Ligilactobacillus apodemi TaxID=307126 RepID=UPI00214B57EF|nr:peptidase T [Ligilactobacillus apodemi]MCR1900665.1 peptidase T [Ligilactobacillus apodemi]
MKSYLQELFIDYAKVNTRSDNTKRNLIPTTPNQKLLAQKIVAELKKIGIDNAYYNEKSGFAIGHLAKNTSAEVTGLGFVAHLDTADHPAENITPQIYSNYNGGKVWLSRTPEIILDPNEFPALKELQGQTLITSDGTTLLGTDDKAGIVAILGALRYFKQHPQIEHGDIYVGFGPDEEIGLGGQRFASKDFNVEFAYTLDNGQPGELQYETFNASEVEILIEGTSVHPGNAYGLLVNAITLGQQFLAQLPQDEVPEKTRGYEGFIMATNATLNINEAKINLIIRDFDKDKFQAKEQLIKKLVAKFNEKLDRPRFKLKIFLQYENIANTLKKHPYAVNLALDAYQRLGLTPQITPFRGGTDGNFLTAKGIPTLNLFNGGGNYHGPYEYVTAEQLVLTARTVIAIVEEHMYQTKFGRNEQSLT